MNDLRVGSVSGFVTIFPRATASSKSVRRSVPLALLAAAAVFLSVASVAWAVGELSQKPGKAGCVSLTGTGGACEVARALDGAVDVAVGPDGRSAYVASLFSDALAIFDRDPLTGALTQKPGDAGCFSNGVVSGCEPAHALDEPIDAVVTPDGRNVYVTARESDSVVVFNRDPATGVLRQMDGVAGCVSQAGVGGCMPGRALDRPGEVAVSPDGRSVYIASGPAIAIFRREPATGALTQLDGKAGCFTEDGSGGTCEDGVALGNALDVEVSPDGASVYVAANASSAVASFGRNQVTGALTQSGCVSDDGTGGACRDGIALNRVQSLAVSPDGASVYGGAGNGVVIFDRDASGGLSQKPGKAGCISDDGTQGACEDGTAFLDATDVVVDADGGSVYVAASNSSAVSILDRNSSGGLTQKAGLAGCISEDGTGGACQDGVALLGEGDLTVSPDGRNVYLGAGESDAVAIFDRALPPPADILAPRVSGFRLMPNRFKPQPKGRSSFRFDLSEPAAVRIEIERTLPGRRVGKRCRAATPKLAAKPRCRRFVRRATLRFANRSEGANAIRFSGRIGKRALASGAYRATIVATDSSGNRSAPRRAGFAILAKKPQRR